MTCRLIASSIDSVRCHRRGAVVRRLAQLPDLAPGSETRIRIADLPLSLDDGTVRLSASGPAVVFDTAIGLEAAERTSAQRSQEEQQLDRATAEEATLRADLTCVEEMLRLLQGVEVWRRPDGAEGEPPQEIDVAARLSLLEFRRARVESLLMERRSLRASIERVKQERQQLQHAVQRLAGSLLPKPNELRKSVVATLRVQSDAAHAETALTLEYFVAAARWAPSYVLRADMARGRATMELRAYVHQSTGEDWSSVNVSLSTAELMRFTELPELTSLRIGRAQSAPKKRQWRPPPCDPAELFADYERDAGPARESATTTPVVQHEGGVSPSTPAMAPPGMMADVAFQPGYPIDDGALVSMSAAPSPAQASPPRNAPMPMAPPMQSAPMRSMGRKGELARRSKEARSDEGGAGLGGGRSGAAVDKLAASPARVEIELDDRLMSYGDLRMPSPEQKKGKLELTSVEHRYLEISATLGVAMTPVVRDVLGIARRFQEPTWPLRCTAPDPSDGFAYVHEGSSRVDIPSDGTFHSIPIAVFESQLTIRHVAVPRESADVFRFLELDSPVDAPLLKGPCDVYFDRDFLVTIELETVPPRGRVRAGLGVDQSVKAARNTTYAETTTGLMGGSLSLKHGINIEIVNHRTVEIDLEVRERVPVAREREDEIKIEILGVQPEWRSWEPTPPQLPVKGAYVWRLRLGPQQRTELSASYVVKIPSKLELSGGNRRD